MRGGVNMSARKVREGGKPFTIGKKVRHEPELTTAGGKRKRVERGETKKV